MVNKDIEDRSNSVSQGSLDELDVIEASDLQQVGSFHAFRFHGP